MRLFFEKEREQAGWRTYTITLFFLFLIILMFSYFNYHYRYQYGALFGVFNKQQYLAKLERSQALSIWIDKYLPNDVKILNAEENRGFYIPRTAVREVWFSKRVNYWEGLQRNEIYKILINEGFTHVVRASSEDHHDSETPLRLKLLDGLLNDHHYAKKLINLRSSNQKEKKYEYAIYEIK